MTPLAEAKNPDTSPERLTQLALLEEKIAREVAKNVNTPPETLKILGSSKDDTTRKYVAGNPNTPLEVFGKLAMQFPKEVLNNPLLPILLMSDASFLEQFPSASLKNMLKRPEMPLDFLEWAAQNSDWNACEGILQNEKASLGTLQILEQRFPNQKRQIEMHIAFANSAFVSAWTLEDLMIKMNARTKHFNELLLMRVGWFSRDEDLDSVLPILIPTLCEMAQHPNTSVETLRTLARAIRFEVRAAVAANPNTPSETLYKLAKDNFNHVRACVAGNLNVPQDVLSILALDRSYDVRLEVAKQQKATVKELRILSEDDDWSVRRAVLENLNISDDIYALLQDDLGLEARSHHKHNPIVAIESLKIRALNKNCSVRWRVAINPNTPSDTLDFLSRDEYEPVREHVASNRNTPPQTLAFMASYETSYDILKSIAKNPNTPIDALIKLMDTQQLFAVAENSSATSEMLNTIFQKMDDFGIAASLYTSVALASNPKTPIHILQKLINSGSSSLSVFYALMNPNIPVEVLQELSQNKLFHWGIAMNPNSPVEILSEIALNPQYQSEIAKSTKLPPQIIEKFSQPDSPVRAYLALNPNLPTEILQKLARDSEFWVRESVAASHPNIPLEILQLLARDKAADVRKAVAKRNFAPIEAQLQFEHCIRVPIDTLQHLSTDTSKFVRAGVAKNIAMPVQMLEQLASDKDAEVRLEVATHAHATTEILQKLFRDKNKKIRAAVAKHAQASSQQLEVLGKDGENSVRLEVAKHLQTPFSTLQILAADTDKAIHETVLLNPSLTREQRTELLMQMGFDFSHELENLLTSLSKSKETSYLPFVHPQAPTAVLAKAGRHTDPLVRAAVALNPKTPESTLKILAQDGDARVRATALARVKGTP
jgi:hypothetical protein